MERPRKVHGAWNHLPRLRGKGVKRCCRFAPLLGSVRGGRIFWLWSLKSFPRRGLAITPIDSGFN